MEIPYNTNYTIQYKGKIQQNDIVTVAKWYNNILYICINRFILSTTDLIEYKLIYQYSDDVPTGYSIPYLNIVNNKIYFTVNKNNSKGKNYDYIIIIDLLKNNECKSKKIKGDNLIGGDILVFDDEHIVLLEYHKKENSSTLHLLTKDLKPTYIKKNLICDYIEDRYIDKNDLLYIRVINIDKYRYDIYNSKLEYINYINIDMNITNYIVNITARLNEDYVIVKERQIFNITHKLYYIDKVNNKFIYLYTYNYNNFNCCVIDDSDNIFTFYGNTITKIEG